MDNLTNIAAIRALMSRHGFHLSKSLGQNFIVNPGICPKIAEQGGAGPGVCALEIGPGIGVLTAELAKRCKKVLAVELDKRLLPVLGETLADYPNVAIHQGDVLKTDLGRLLAEHFAGEEVVVCANLPYYITSPVLMKLLEDRLPVRSVTVMVQREAAERICAPMPSRQAGAITAAIRYRAAPHLLFSVSPGSFLPPPKVQSSVIRLDILEKPPVEAASEEMLFRVIRGGFSQRRKTLLNCLSASVGMEKGRMAELLRGAGVDPSARAEALGLAEFASVANALVEQGG